jgi:hypothetical protein
VASTDKFEPGAAEDRSGADHTCPAAGACFSPWCFGFLLALALVATFPFVVAGLRAFVFRDYGVLAYPFAFYQRQCFWRGELPLWNPLSNCGAPFLAQWGTMVLYPLSLVYLVLPMPWSLGIFCLGHLWLAGFGMYSLARRWTGNGFAASVAGLVFVFNGITLSCLIWPNYTVALGWMPWVVLLAERAWREGGRTLIWAIAVSALQLLSGVPEIVLFTWLFVLAVCAGESWKTEAGRWRIDWRSWRRLLTIAIAVAGLTAAQTLPFLDLLSHSQRDTGFATTRWTLPGWGWANLLVPLFHCFETYQGVFFQHDQEFFSSVYLGLGPLMLAILAAGQVRRKRVWLLTGVAMLSLILALGDNGFVYAWLRRLVPVLGFGRFPVKFLVLTTFTVPLLAAFAVAQYQTSWFTEGDAPRRYAVPGREIDWRPIAVVGGVLVALMLAILWFAHRYPFPLDQWLATWKSAVGRIGFVALMWICLFASSRLSRPAFQRLAQVATLVVLVFDVLKHAPSQNPTVSAEVFTPGMHELKPPPRIGQGRVMISPTAEEHLLRSTVRSPADDFVGKRLALWSNLNALDEVPKVNGSSTLQLREQAQVQSLLYATPKTDLPRLADFLSAANITAPGTVVEWTNRPTSLPWVTAGQKPNFADATNTLRGLTAPDFDPRTMVYLPLEAKASVNIPQATGAHVGAQRVLADHVEVEVEATTPSLVVIGQSFYHPWAAFVDGARVRLWRANHAFQALVVPAGKHRVEVVYQDRRFDLGALISGATLLALAAAWLRLRNLAGANTPPA